MAYEEPPAMPRDQTHRGGVLIGEMHVGGPYFATSP